MRRALALAALLLASACGLVDRIAPPDDAAAATPVRAPGPAGKTAAGRKAESAASSIAKKASAKAKASRGRAKAAKSSRSKSSSRSKGSSRARPKSSRKS